MYCSFSSEWCRHLCKPHPYHDKVFSSPDFPPQIVSLSNQATHPCSWWNHCCNYFHHSLVCSSPSLEGNHTVCASLCLISFALACLGFIHVVVCIHSLFLFYCWVVFHGLFIHSFVDGHLCCFLCLAIMNQAVMNIFYKVWLFVFPGHIFSFLK